MQSNGKGFAGVVSQKQDSDELLAPIVEKLTYRGEAKKISLKSGDVSFAQIGKAPMTTWNEEKIILRHVLGLDIDLNELTRYVTDKHELLNNVKGHFSVSAYNIQDECLYLTRDIFGTRPLFYLDGDNYFAFSSDLYSLTLISNYTRRPNHSFLRKYVVEHDYPNIETRYKDIKRVPSGGTIIHKSRIGDTFSRKWGKPEMNVMDKKKASTLFRKRLSEVIDKTLIKNKTGIQVSGGLDSASVASIASEAKHHRDKPSYYSVTYENEIPKESKYLKEIESDKDIHIEKYKYRNINDFTGLKSNHLPKDIFYSPFYLMHIPIFRQLRKKGKELVMTGVGGDEITGSSFYKDKYYYYVKELRVKKLLNELVVAFDERWLSSFIYNLIKINISHTLGYKIPKLCLTTESRPFFVNRSYSSGIGVGSQKNFETRNLIHDNIYYSLTGSDETLEAMDKISSSNGLHMLHPFEDRELLDIVLSVDVSSLFRPGETKRLLKSALNDYIPSSLLSRRTKSGYDLIYRDEINRNMDYVKGLILHGSYSPDYIDNKKLLDFLSEDMYRNKIESLNSFWRLIKVKHWYETNSFA